MKALHYLFIACILILTSCSNSSDNGSKENSVNSTELNLPANFYKKLKGKIGEDFNVTMDLVCLKDSVNNSTSLNGHYFYDKVGMPLSLYGDINDSGKFELRETDKDGNNTGIFKGAFVSNNEIKGTWTNPKTKKTFPFTLTAIEEFNNMFSFADYYNENCKWRDKNMKSTNKDTLNWFDTSCCKMHISLISLTNTESKAIKKMNDLILKSLLGMSIGEKPYGSINELIGSVDGFEDGDILDAEYSTGIISNENNILSMSVSSWANTGGAHPNYFSIYLNFDTRTGDTISLLDIVQPETIDELVARAKIQFVKENGDIKENGWFWDAGEFVLPNSFSINKGGLLFVYQPYEAGPYAMGMPQFFLSFKQLKDIVRPEYLKL